ncbi:MAG TPA: lipoyl synthase [Acidimicrobiales bacterium]|nr:lipoyl synthase [Acidimicrobiales bacterium]
MLRIRWLGKVPYQEALTLQRSLFSLSKDDYLLLLEHPAVYTMGPRTNPAHILEDHSSLGADIVFTDRGGDVTFHGPGQLVGYPILSFVLRPGVVADHVNTIEQVVIDALVDLGVNGATRKPGCPGVWFIPESGQPRKICAIGVKMSRGRTMHGFALNVSTDPSWFDKIVPCGIEGAAVTSLVLEGYEFELSSVVDAIVARAGMAWGDFGIDTANSSMLREGESLKESSAGVSFRSQNPIPGAHSSSGTHVPVAISERKPHWLRAKAEMGSEYRKLKATMRELDLVTVCEEAGCPNIYECWAEGTSTFMINGDRCTRACGFCLVDTRRPLAMDPDEPDRVAEAVARMKLTHAVVTAVARDDLEDGGASGFCRTITAIRSRCPGTSIEVLIPDCKGKVASLVAIFASQPDVLNHNLETVLRLQRKVRPSAGYARSLAVLASAKAAGLTTKSGLMVGLGETEEELIGALADLRAVGVDIVTIGQYLRPSRQHLEVSKWWTPDEIQHVGQLASSMGFSHVEASPLARSSYHARRALEVSDPRSVQADSQIYPIKVS